MIKYGLKLWSTNTELFAEAASLYEKKEFDFIELLHNPHADIDFPALDPLKNIPVMIHAPHSGAFHEFEFGLREKALWVLTKKLADYFRSSHIIVHAGRAKNFDSFIHNLELIDDKRILIENMGGLDLEEKVTFGFTLPQLQLIYGQKKICFDLEKAVKSACYQGTHYQEFISTCLSELKPLYFHLSGGNMKSTRDEHLNLQEANFDVAWMKRELEKISNDKDIFLVFEVPKDKGLENDLANMHFFKKL